MKILFDARWILLDNRFDGVSRYSHELAHALANQKGIEVSWLVYDQRQLDKLPKGEAVWANNPNNMLKEFFTLARTVNKSGHKLLYSPFFTVGTLGKKFKLVLTIHDMIYFTHRTPPQWLPWHVRLGWWLFHLTYWPMRWQLNKADMVATVSSTARQELLKAKATTRKIKTVPNAVSETFKIKPARGKKNGVVYMGAFTPYKNVECVIDAVALVPDVTLHLCGKLPATRRPEIEQRLKDRGISDRTIIYDGASDQEYLEALSNARCAISASRLEGFGLPLLEAQAAGVPFVAADTDIFREVGADSVAFFNPDEPGEAAQQIILLGDEKTRKQFIKKGYENASRYTWDNSAKMAIKICQEVSES